MDEKTLDTIQERLQEGALFHLERAEELVQVLRPSAPVLASALLEGRTVVLLSREENPSASRNLSVILDMDRRKLHHVLSSMEFLDERERAIRGCASLCLTFGRLLGPAGISAPPMVLPVILSRSGKRWQLSSCGTGLCLNMPVLNRLSPRPPEEGWKDDLDGLQAQLTALLAERSIWSQTDGLWLAKLPLWALNLSLPGSDFTPPGCREDAPALTPEDCSGEEGIIAPLSLDAGQMTALRRLKSGGHLLAQGSRGTGKTQLAAALMANGIGDRQRVLYISPAWRDRESLTQRMGELLLEPFCLRLEPMADQVGDVLRQFNRSAQLRPATSSDDYFPLAASSLSLGQQLDRSSTQLHQPGQCGLTLFELICRYLECRDAEGFLPIPDSSMKRINPDGLQERLDCAEALYATVKQIGHPFAHPLYPVHAVTCDPEQLEQLPEVVKRLLEAVQDLEDSLGQWLERTELEHPVHRSDWARLQKAGRLLLEWRDLPQQWKSSPRIPLLADMMQDLRQRTDQVELLHAQIEEAWGEKVFNMNAVELEKQWRYYQADWTLPSDPERESTLRRLLAESEAHLNLLEQVGVHWSKTVQTALPTTRDSWERCYEVATELARWKEIPREWCDCESLDALLWDVGELIDVGKKARESKQILLRDWNEAFLTLDGADMLDTWLKEENNLGLGWLKRQSDLRERLQPLCKFKLNSDVIENGLRWLADYQREIRQCDEIFHRWERELKAVYRREDTVWVWLDTARRVAGESHNWLSELTGSEDFLRRYGSSEAAVNAAVTLQEQWEQARDVMGRLDAMIGRTAQPDSANWLSDRRADCRRLRNLMNIRAHVNTLVKDPISMAQIGETLDALSAYQQEEGILDSLYERWEAELDGLYEGTDTDWDTLCAMAAHAVESDEQITQLTGDLTMRANLADDAEALEAAETLVSAFDRVEAAERQIQDAFEVRLCTDTGVWVDQLRENTATLLQYRELLPVWIRWNALRHQAEELGLRSFVNCYEQYPEEGQDLSLLFRKSIYRWALLLELNRQHRQFSSRRFNETLRQYLQTQRQFTQRTREELFHLCASYAARALRTEDNQQEIEYLRNANLSGAAGISTRHLLHAVPHLVQDCFPCVVTTPWDALRCFAVQAPEQPPFDYVILEQAGQYPDWMGCQLLKLGRTALLLSSGERLMEGVPAAEDGSLWQQCIHAGWPVLPLDTCYLPRQESLHWVDAHAYGTRCLPTARPDDFLFSYHPVLGRMEQGSNLGEAESVIDELLRQLNRGRRSIGIVAMTWQQRSLLRLLLGRTASEQPELAAALRRVEVAAPEEVISGRYELALVSLTLASDHSEQALAAARIAAQWDGWHMISDAVSAGREGVLVFSSMDQDDLATIAPSFPAFPEWLDYLRRKALPHRDYPVENRIQQELCMGLNKAGYAASPGPQPISVQVALKEQPDRPLLGILLDDARYSALCRTEEREVSRTQLLQERGWQLCRVWAMDWWRSTREVLDGLCQIMEHIPQKQRPAPARMPEPEAEVPLYRPASLAVMGIRAGEVSNPSFRSRITRIVDEILQQEAPISRNQLATRLLELMGLDAQDDELRRMCEKLWMALGLRVTREGELSFFWQGSQDPDRWREFRRSGTGDSYRAPEDVSAQESANAACYILGRDATLTPLALARETARLLGYDPAEDAALECGRRGVEHALFLGRLMETVIGGLMPGVRK